MNRAAPAFARWPLHLTVLLAVVFIIGFMSTAVDAGGVNLVIDGKVVKTTPAPYITGGRTLVPVRAVSETLGAYVGWHQQDRTVIIIKGNQRLRLRVGHRLVNLSGTRSGFYLLDGPPRIRNNRTFVPIRFVSSAFGAAVRWDGSTSTVFIDSGASQPVLPKPPLALTSVVAGQTITGSTDLSVQFRGPFSAPVAEVRYLLLDPDTGQGPMVAQGDGTGTYRWIPDPAYSGDRLLAAAAYDEGGHFLAGDVVPVKVEVHPKVFLAGISPGDTIEGSLPLAVNVNFLATHVRYELVDPETGVVTLLAQGDPWGQTYWTPGYQQNGSYFLRAVAYDRSGQAYSSPEVPVTVAVARRLALTGISAGKVVDSPVTLGVSVNFSAHRVQYLLRDPVSGRKEVLAELKGAAKYRWIPTPEQEGKHEVLAGVTDQEGNTYYTDPVVVEVRTSPGVFMETVGPGQVLTGKVVLRAVANVPLEKITYQLVDPETAVVRTIASGTDVRASFSWTPGPEDDGSWVLRAVGVTPTGSQVVSDEVPVRVYTGPLYGPEPVIEKDRFLDFATGLALPTQARTGMSAALQVAQAILESGWGQFAPADKYTGKLSYNLFGIKGEGPAGSVTANTWEEYRGVVYYVDAKFRAYHSPKESWQDHENFLLTKSRYRPFREVMHDAIQGAWALKRAGYATDSRYPLKLIDIMKRYNLLELDEVKP